MYNIESIYCWDVLAFIVLQKLAITLTLNKEIIMINRGLMSESETISGYLKKL